MVARSLLFASALFLTACRGGIDIPTEYPTPPPAGPIAAAPPLTYKTDPELEKQIKEIAAAAKGKVGAAAVLLETGDSAFVDADGQYPMQSVYKLPIAMAVMDKVRQNELDLGESIGVTKDDMVRPGMRSPLRDENPNGGEFKIRELIRLSLVESDGSASDVLLRLAGGPFEVQSFLTRLGIRDMKVANPEKEIGRDWQTQYANWSSPRAAAELLRVLFVRGAVLPPNSESEDPNFNLLLVDMNDSIPGPKRLRGLLPSQAIIVPHKTGTGGTQNGITGATNDIGIIYLPNGKHAAIAVFVSDSPASLEEREAVIARIAKAVWDRWSVDRNN